MNKRQRAIYECDKCGKEINGLKAYYILQHQRQDQHRKGYCSKQCARLGNIKDRVKLKCECCDKEFYKEQCRVNGGNNFCSSRCSAIYNNSIKSLTRANVKLSRKIIQRQMIDKFALKADRPCLNCKKNMNCYPHQEKKYCSRKCSSEYEYSKFIQQWKSGEIAGGDKKYGQVSSAVRKYLFKKYDSKCTKCNWSEINQYSQKIPLQIDHVNGNAYDHSEKNLSLLCPNCHSLTETYMALNSGHGRQARKEYRKKHEID